jgi:uncharacterized protein (DUF58 family)
MNRVAGPLFDEALLAELRHVRLLVRASLARTGEGRAPGRAGGRFEFRGHRRYGPGDDLRSLDWPAYARTGRLFVREFDAEHDFDAHLLADGTASLSVLGKREAALRLLAAVGTAALASGARVTVGQVGGGGARLAAPVEGEARWRAMLGAIEALPEPGGRGLARGLEDFAARVPGRSLVVLVSDLLDEDAAARPLRALAERGADVVVLHLLAAEEEAPQAWGPVRLRDAETGETLERDADEGAAASVLAAAARFRERWARTLEPHGARVVPVRAGAPLRRALLPALRAARLVR